MGKFRHDRGKWAWSPPNSTIRMMRVTAKQKHQVNMAQLPMGPVQAPTLATSEKATQVDISCRRRRRPSGWVSARADPTVVEDDVVVVMVVRVTVTGMAAPLTEDRKEKVPAAKAARVAHLEKADQKPPLCSGPGRGLALLLLGGA